MTDPAEPSIIVVDPVPDGPTPILDEGSEAEEGRVGKVGWAFIGFSMLAGMIAGVLAFTITLPYLALEPGSTFETEEFVAVEGTPAFMSPGEVSFVTVTQRRLTPFRWVVARLDDGSEIFHEDELLQGRTLDEQREENAQLMITSQNSAIAAALGHLGFETDEPAGVVIVDVVEGGPLDGVLARNDVISSIDGRPVTELSDLVDYLQTQLDTSVQIVAGRAGEDPQTVTVELTRDTAGFLGVGAGEDPTGEERGAYIGEVIEGGSVEDLLEVGDRIVRVGDVPVASFGDLVPELVERRAGDVVSIEALRDTATGEELISGEVTLGVRILERAGLLNVSTQFRYADLPIEVRFTTENIGGPSAGLAFTMTVLDVLTEGDLTGGANIVVTGSIDRAGNIGPIGGVHQKAFAAVDVDADIFLVPAANLEEARAAVSADDLRIESVSTLNDALEIVAEFGGNATDLPTADEL